MSSFFSIILGLTIPLTLLADGGLSKFEKQPPGELEMTFALAENIKKTIREHRDAHPKAHGCVDEIRLTVLESSDPDLNHGIFSNPGDEFKAIARFSSGSSNPNANDHEPGGQGFALKILLPESEQLRVADIPEEKYFLDTQYYKTLDIITISGLHEFMVSTVADYPAFFRAIALSGAAAKEAAEQGKSPAEIAAARFKALNDHYLHLDDPAKARPREAALMQQSSKHKVEDLTTTAYQSWVPSLLGDNAVKYQIRPCESNASLFQNQQDPSADFLSHRLASTLIEGETCFEFAMQKHLEGFPSVEDAAASWDREESPYISVARITIPQKTLGKEFMDADFCETLSFNPGHAPIEHRPIGGINRSRVRIYASIETTRNEHRSAARK